MQTAKGTLREFLFIEDLCAAVLSYVPSMHFTWATSVEPCFFKVAIMAPFSNNIAIGLENGMILVCDASNGRCLHRLTGNFNSITSLIDCGDGLLAAAASNGAVGIWNCETRQCVSSFQICDFLAHIKLAKLTGGDLAYSVTASCGSRVEVVSRETLFRERKCDFTPPFHTVQTMLATARNTLLVTNGDTMCQHCAETGTHLATVTLGGDKKFWWHRSEVTLLNLPGDKIASLVDGVLDIWQSADLAKLLTVRHPIASVLMAVCFGCLVLEQEDNFPGQSDHFKAVVCTESHVFSNNAVMPASACQQMISLPNNRLVTRHDETFHVWTMCVN